MVKYNKNCTQKYEFQRISKGVCRLFFDYILDLRRVFIWMKEGGKRKKEYRKQKLKQKEPSKTKKKVENQEL